MTLQIHRSETAGIDAVIDRFAATTARRLLIWTYTCTSIHCTLQQTASYRHFKYIIPIKSRNVLLVIHFTRPFLATATPIFTARRYASLLTPGVRPSVRLSVRHVWSAHVARVVSYVHWWYVCQRAQRNNRSNDFDLHWLLKRIQQMHPQ